MKRITRNLIIAASFITSFVLSGCTEEKPAALPESNEEVTWRITASLEDSEPATRLDYFESGKALKAYWSSEDQIAANGKPSTFDYVYVFDLIEGANTSTGVFQCTASTTGKIPQLLKTPSWTLYYPGSKIRCESEYLNFSYAGQVQKGNGNMDHLDDYHTIRIICTDQSEESSTIFQDAFIDFSGNDNDESSCMKFNLSNLPSITPTEVSLKYSAPEGEDDSACFYQYNVLERSWGGIQSNLSTSNKISIRLEDFEPCSEATVYMMMSNRKVDLKAGGTLTILVKSKEGKLYSCSKTLKSDATLEGGRLHKISGSSWTESVAENIDGFDNPEEGIVVLQEATKGDGTDIIIMGDGFDKTHFGSAGDYDEIMRKAYSDFFSVEPYTSLKEYFNVYYINAVSAEDHDAETSLNGEPLLNGAIQGDASTIFSTQFTPNTTSITGDDNATRTYAAQAIRKKGGKNGSECTDEDEISSRVNSSLIMVMVNVKCHAGTCSISYNFATDYCAVSSVAYTALSRSEEMRRWTLIHEAGGHGFGKLSDEYGDSSISSSNSNAVIINNWDYLIKQHNSGLYRNINEHWTADEEAEGWSALRETYTDKSNVYWSDLLDASYGYTTSEGLGIYRGGNTYSNLFCRPTNNSVMRNQFETDGHYFNAISRWAIWYRLMRLTNSTDAQSFKESLNDFIAFDKKLTIEKNSALTKSCDTEGLLPLATPVLIYEE